MKIPLSAIDGSMFTLAPVSHDVLGPLVRISPKKQKHRWTAQELHLRSLICRPDGEILSSGFPKFMNLGEDAERDAQARSAAERGAVWFTEKRDGTLIIRDVIDGFVLLRTRGYHDLPDHRRARIRAFIAEHHPALCDPSVHPEGSILMELCSPHPDDRIILAYPEPGLTLLGWMKHHAHQLPTVHGTPAELSALAEVLGVPPVSRVELPADFEAAQAEVWAWLGREGVVARYGLPTGGLGLVKLKAERYLRSHAALSHLTPRRLRRFCFAALVTSPATFAAALHARGVDWESVRALEPSLQEYLSHRRQVIERTDAFLAELSRLGLRGLPMKAAVARLRTLCAAQASWADLFSLGISHLRGRDTAAQVGSLILDMRLGAFQDFCARPARALELFPQGS